MIMVKKALNEGKTSKSVLAKLSVDIWKKNESVITIFKQHEDFKEMLAPWKSFLSLAFGLSKGMAFKYMGEAANEEAKHGLAVSFLQVASVAIQTVWVPSPGTALQRFAKEIEEAKADIEHMKRSFENENNHIYYDKVIAENMLEIAEQKCLMQAINWMPPQPAYNSIGV